VQCTPSGIRHPNHERWTYAISEPSYRGVPCSLYMHRTNVGASVVSGFDTFFFVRTLGSGNSRVIDDKCDSMCLSFIVTKTAMAARSQPWLVGLSVGIGVAMLGMSCLWLQFVVGHDTVQV
jgi:hypothetical protein